MLKRLAQIAFALAALYLLATVAVFAFQRALFYRLQAKYETPAAVKLIGTAEVPIVTADGLHLIAWHSPAPAGAPTLVYFHGNGGGISMRHWRIRRGQKMGYGVFLVGYRGFSGGDGTPSEEGLYSDARAALDWLGRHGVPSTSTILYGESLGSGIAVKMAIEHRVAGVILEAPFTSVVDVAALNYWMFPVRWLMWDRFDSLSRIKEINAPLLVMHGALDATIPQSQGRALLDAANEPKLGYFPPDAHHLDLVLHGAYDQIDAFIAKFWKQAPQEHMIDVSDHAFATRCGLPYSPPPVEKIDAFIERAQRIVRVEVLSVGPNPEQIWQASPLRGTENVIYELGVIETLKGLEEPHRFRLPGVSVKHRFSFDPALLDVSYRHAKGLALADGMDFGLGRTDRFAVNAIHGFCEYAPRFEVGLEYLLFLPDAFSPISAEPVTNLYDPWYERVLKKTPPRWGLY